MGVVTEWTQNHTGPILVGRSFLVAREQSTPYPTHLAPLRAFVSGRALEEEVDVVREESRQHDRHRCRQRQEPAQLAVVMHEVLFVGPPGSMQHACE